MVRIMALYWTMTPEIQEREGFPIAPIKRRSMEGDTGISGITNRSRGSPGTRQ